MISSETRSLLEIPQQFLLGEAIDADTEYKLGRACVAHCAAAVDYLHEPQEAAYESLVQFVLEYGAGSKSEYYSENKGWNAIAIADLLRLKGYTVVAQNLANNTLAAEFDRAVASGRARTDKEKSLLNLYTPYSGDDRDKWLATVDSTLTRGGSVISTITIPLLSGLGFGGHSVIINNIDHDNGNLIYFDPDHYNIQRYGQSPPVIERMDDRLLQFQRPITDHLSVMTGEVLHILPPTN